MAVTIEAALNKNKLDLLIMQKIAECKLNRELTDPSDDTVKHNFYNNYKLNDNTFYNINGSENTNLINQFKVSVGAVANLSDAEVYNTPDYTSPSLSSYEGGAGRYTKITSTQIDDFIKKYDIIDYHGNDDSGFSATVFKNKLTNELTISFRSTEFGEDYLKDAVGADGEMAKTGTAFGQTAALVKYIEELKVKLTNSGNLTPTTEINATGYSLGSHLAANFYKMYSQEFNIKELVAFNGPGVGSLSSQTGQDPYVELKNELKDYNLIIDVFQRIKVQLNIENKEFNLLNSVNILSAFSDITLGNKAYATSILNYMDTKNELKKSLESPLLYSKISSNLENETNKKSLIDYNNNLDNLNTTIYGNDFYKNYISFLKDKYNAYKVGVDVDTNTNSTSTTMTNILKAGGIKGSKTGYNINGAFYDNKASWIGGFASPNYGNTIANDFNFVHGSNIYTNPIDIIIEDRNELEKTLDKIPGFEKWTNLGGDFGNTHSITLLDKSMSLMNFLSDIENSNSAYVKKYTGLISAATAEKATHWISQLDLERVGSGRQLNIGDNNSVAMITNILYKAIKNQSAKEIIFDNNFEDWANIDKINSLLQMQKEIKEELQSKSISINIMPLYYPKESDFNYPLDTSTHNYLSKDDIYQKSMQNNDEGLAYRYALENLNPFVITGIDYLALNFKTKNINNYSPEWYKSRSEVLLAIIKSNVQNTGDYLATHKVSIDDNNQGFKFSTIADKYPNINNASYSSFSQSITNTNFADTYYKKRGEVFHYDTIFSKIVTENGFLRIVNGLEKTTQGLNKTVEATKAQELNFKNNIYYLNPLKPNFYSASFNDSEKVFINPDKLSIYNLGDTKHLNDYIFFNGQDNTGIDNFGLISKVNLNGGDDYVEIKNDYAEISSTKGKKTYYLNAKETVIDDPDKTGTITMDGILLTGGIRIVDGARIQTEIINGVVHTFNYEVDVLKSNLIIKHENTGNKVIINNMTNYGNGTSFNFVKNPYVQNDSVFNLDLSNFIKDVTRTVKKLSLKPSYTDHNEFNEDLKIFTGFTDKSIRFREGDNLIFYEKGNPNQQYVIEDYFDIGNALKQQTAQYQTIDAAGNVINQWPITGYISFPDTIEETNDTHLSTYKNSGVGYYIDDLLNKSIGPNNSVINYRGTDIYIVDQSILRTTTMQKSGSDLLFVSATGNYDKTIIIKGYFEFDHTDNTNIYKKDGNDMNDLSDFSLISLNELNSILPIILTTGHDLYYMPVNTDTKPKIVNGGDGDDTIIGSVSDEIFQSSGARHLLYGHTQTDADKNYVDGNDTFTGGGGNDIFVFGHAFGDDVITDFDNGDKIYIDGGLSQSIRDNNDLIIKSVDSTLTGGSRVRIKDYFLNIDYEKHTLIHSFASSSQYDPRGDNSDGNNPLNTESSISSFSDAQIEDFTTYELQKDQKNLTQTGTQENKPLISGYRKFTMNNEDNNIVITQNNTIIKARRDNSDFNVIGTDGDDQYTIAITNPEPAIKNPYRVNIEFLHNSGDDNIKGASFKKENMYGDVVKIRGVTSDKLAFSTTMKDGYIANLTIVLDDGSTMTVDMPTTLEDHTQEDAIIIELDNEKLTLQDILDLNVPVNLFADSSNSVLSANNSYKKHNLFGNDQNNVIFGSHNDDLIVTGKGNDTVFLSSGNDTYIIEPDSGIDTFHFKDFREKINVSLILDSSYNVNDVHYSFDEANGRIYLSFSPTNGIVFEEAEWLDFVFLNDGLKISQQGIEVAIPDEIKLVDSSPFVMPPPPIQHLEETLGLARKLTGTNGNDFLTANMTHNNIIFGGDGNDQIIGARYSPNRSFIFGGKGDDYIQADYQDIITFKDGDGHDVVYSDWSYYILNIVKNNPVINTYPLADGSSMNVENLFSFSLSGYDNNDIVIKYSENGDTITIDNFFNADTGLVNNNPAISVYNKEKDQMGFYYIGDILNEWGLSKDTLIQESIIMPNVSYDVNTGGATPYWISPENAGFIVGGDISYQYLENGSYQLNNYTNNILGMVNQHNTIIQRGLFPSN